MPKQANTPYTFTTIGPISDSTANHEQQDLFNAAQAALGLVPNMYRSMANAPSLLRSYLKSYTEFREHSGFTPIEQELVFLSLSKDNGCHYCLAAHSMIAIKVANMPKELLDALREAKPISDPKLDALRELSLELNRERGRPNSAVVQKALDEGYSEKALLAILNAISAKTISNYSNHLFANTLDDAFKEFEVI